MISKTVQEFRQNIQKREILKRILLNIGWVFFDKVLRMGFGFAINVLIARYLGVNEFGVLNYAIAFVALFSVFSTLGLESIVVKELVKAESTKNEILGASFFLKFIGGITGLLLSIITILIVRKEDMLVIYLVIIAASGFTFQSFDIIDYYYQSKLQSKFIVYARNAAFLISAVLKIGMLYLKASLVFFALAILIELMLTALFLVWIYFLKDESILKWQIKWQLVKKLLYDSFPLILASLVILIYMRTDQLMLGNMIGDREVGVFSVAVRLSEIWYVIPSVITSSILPAFLKAKEVNSSYLNKMQQSFDIMAILGMVTAVIISSMSYFIIENIYGVAYIKAGPILAIHAWTSIFVFLGFASGNWFITENKQKYVFYRSAAGAIINVILNFFLIPIYAGTGAAIGTLVAQFVASYFFNLCNKQTLPVFKMQTLALLKVTGLYFIYNLTKKSHNG